MGDVVTSASLTAQNTFGDWKPILGLFNISISGTWAGTITLQKTFDFGTTVMDVDSYVANIEDVRLASNKPPARALYRLGFKTGNYTSGTAVVAIND